ncbi:MAG: hypothetical protein K2Y29_17670 [Beijerinckiaceae bacterium]|nr:hypothetical protein [Beijerinckiaceae bacterium]
MKGAAVNASQGDNEPGADRNAQQQVFQPGRRLTPQEEKSRRARNYAIAAGLVFLIILFYLVTIAKLGVGVVVRPSI